MMKDRPFIPTDSITPPERLGPVGRALFRARDRIIAIWARRVRAQIKAAEGMDEPALIDTLPQFLDNLAEALTPGLPRGNAVESTTVARGHGGGRALVTHFNPVQLIREYQILRRTLFEELVKDVPLSPMEHSIIEDSIDGALQDAMAEFAEVQRRIRQQFIATLTHDLRNPLSAATMAAEAIAWEPDASDMPMLASKIVENLRRVDRMVQDLLDATFVGMGGRLPLTVEPFDIQEVVQDVARQFGVSHERSILLQGESTEGYWSKDKIHRALENLVSNAFKYGDPKSPVTIRTVSHHGRLTLSVHNEGSVISPEEQTMIFQPFRRTESAIKDKEKQGWGLGLSLVKGVAEAHGGTVQVDSAAGRGTTFVFDVPMDARAYQESLTAT